MVTLDELYPSQTCKMELFLRLFDEVKHQEGDIAEFGVYNGGGTRQLAFLDPSRYVWAFDTFEGMPKADFNGDEDSSDPPGKWAPNGTPDQLFRGIENVKVMKGRFVETLPLVPPNVRFVLIHLDCDWYNSYRQVLEFLTPRLQPGAVLVNDDPGLPGADRALREWFLTVGERATQRSRTEIVWRG